MKFPWKNVETRLFPSARFISITEDPFTHRVIETLTVFWSLMYFFYFLMVYPVCNAGAQATTTAIEKWIHSFGTPQSVVHDEGTTSINTEFISWTEVLGITLRPRTTHSLWTSCKMATQNQDITRYCRNFLNDAENNWSSLDPNFAFVHNTSVNYTTERTSYEILFGTKPQIPTSLRLVLYHNEHKWYPSDFCIDVPPRSHSENNLKNQLMDNLFRPQLSQTLLERERDF